MGDREGSKMLRSAREVGEDFFFFWGGGGRGEVCVSLFAALGERGVGWKGLKCYISLQWAMLHWFKSRTMGCGGVNEVKEIEI